MLFLVASLGFNARSQIIDVDFGGGPGPSQKTGLAATGQSDSDFWNYFNQAYGAAAGSLSNLKLVDGQTVTSAGITVQNAPGGWGNGSSDPMYNDFIYPWSGGNITITLANLPVGAHDVYLYCSDGDYQISCGGVDYGTQSCREYPVVNPPNWQEGVQYVLFHSVMVDEAGQPVVITVLPGMDGLPVISGLQVAPGTPPPPPPPPCVYVNDLVSWWRGENDTSDAVGSNNGYALNGAGFANGKVGRGFEFDGIDDSITIPYSPSLVTPTFTVETWIKPESQVDNLIGQESIFEQSYGEFQLCVRRGYSGVQVVFLISDNSWAGYSEVGSTSEIPIGQFTHVAGTWDGATLRLYINGTLDAEYTTGTTPIASACDFHIGGINHNQGDACDYVGQFFHGIVDELSFYGRALEGSEIHSIYAADATGKCGPFPPIIITQPIDQTVTVGETATFNVVAKSSWPMRYQWKRNGWEIPGATSSRYTVISANFTDEAVYSVSINNPMGSVESAPATLSVVNSTKPVAYGQERSTTPGSSVQVTLRGVDSRGNPLTYALPGWSNPPSPHPTSKGTLSGTPPNLTYTANVGASGDDSFTFKVNNSIMDSELGTILIHIVPNAGDMNTGQDASNDTGPSLSATLLPAVVSGTGLIGTSGDLCDHYRVAVVRGAFIRVSLSGVTTPVLLTLFGPDFAEQASVTIQSGQSQTIFGNSDATGFMYVRLTSSGISSTPYNMSVAVEYPVEMDPTDWAVLYGATIVNPPEPLPPYNYYPDFYNPDGTLRPDVSVIGGPEAQESFQADISPGPGALAHAKLDPATGGFELTSWEGYDSSATVKFGDDSGGSKIIANGHGKSADAVLKGTMLGLDSFVEVEANVVSSGVTLEITAKCGETESSLELTGPEFEYNPDSFVEGHWPLPPIFGVPLTAGVEVDGGFGVRASGGLILQPNGFEATGLQFGAGGSLDGSGSIAVGIHSRIFTLEAGFEGTAHILDGSLSYVADCYEGPHADGLLTIEPLNFDFAVYGKWSALGRKEQKVKYIPPHCSWKPFGEKKEYPLVGPDRGIIFDPPSNP